MSPYLIHTSYPSSRMLLTGCFVRTSNRFEKGVQLGIVIPATAMIVLPVWHFRLRCTGDGHGCPGDGESGEHNRNTFLIKNRGVARSVAAVESSVLMVEI